MSFLPTHQKDAFRIHVDDPTALYTLSSNLREQLSTSLKSLPPLIICIGTDRSTGDSLGPLTGWRLTSLLRKHTVEVFGTVDTPVHAQNLSKVLSEIDAKIKKHTVIAVDACLGSSSNIGTVLIEPAPLNPGSALKKVLPSIGDISISGVVNAGGFFELQVLQNTRLSLVLKMSQLIADGIYFSLLNPIRAKSSPSCS